jgi:hypothetical protein
VHETARVIHRDISLKNIMYRRKADNSVYGVLSDFDLSFWLNPTGKQDPTSK